MSSNPSPFRSPEAMEDPNDPYRERWMTMSMSDVISSSKME